MPTGYTYPVADGTVTDFNAFVMSCARAFGACIEMRGDPADAPIPEEFKPTRFWADKLANARDKLAKIESMTVVEVADAAAADYQQKMAAHNAYEAERALSDERLDAMLQKVMAWSPPTAEHDGLKNFMIEQLTISKRGAYRSEPPEQVTAAEWQRAQIEGLHHSIGYYAAEDAKEIERARGRTEWIKALRASLSPAPETAARVTNA